MRKFVWTAPQLEGRCSHLTRLPSKQKEPKPPEGTLKIFSMISRRKGRKLKYKKNQNSKFSPKSVTPLMFSSHLKNLSSKKNFSKSIITSPSSNLNLSSCLFGTHLLTQELFIALCHLIQLLLNSCRPLPNRESLRNIN